MYAVKEAGGNPESTNSHAKVDEASVLMQKAVSDLRQTLEKARGEAAGGLTSGTHMCVCCVFRGISRTCKLVCSCRLKRNFGIPS